MIPVLSLHTSIPLLFTPLSRPLNLKPPPVPLQPQRSRRPRYYLPVRSLSNSGNRFQENPFRKQPRTLFPGGYKRPEIKVPSLVLQLTPDEALGNGNGDSVLETLDLVDEAVSRSVGIVVLSGGEGGSGKRLYEAACVLKSVIRDRAYLLIAERVDIAAAVNASGVVLSDQGLPAIVARNMMANARADSIILPLVARNVQSASAMSVATNSDGADFVICNMGEEKLVDDVSMSLSRDVNIPVFIVCSIKEEATVLNDALKMLKFGVSGLVVSLRDLSMLGNEVLDKLLNDENTLGTGRDNELNSFSKSTVLKERNGHHGKGTVSSFPRMDDREKQLIEKEKNLLMEAINVIQKAAPLMEEVPLLIDAVSQIDEPFLLVIVGEFNSGKSSFINALLGERYLKEGVVPTTNEITFLRYSELDVNDAQNCERHPDGRYICYLPAPILKEMTVVDTPGTNVILQRQQRLTEEFIPRADLLLFVISADRPLTESEVVFLRYTQQWKKKVVFVLNKSDIYQNASQLEEATLFIRENTQKLLNVEEVTLYPVSARYALEAKLSDSYDAAQDHGELSVSDSLWRITSFYEFEKFLYSFLDRSTSRGEERIRLKLETPIRVAEQLISSCETLIRQEHQNANKDLNAVLSIVDSFKDYAMKMESESISWRRQILSLIDNTKSRILEIAASTLQLSNLDFVVVYVFKGEKSSSMPGTSKVQNDVITPALLDARRLLGEYVIWLHSTNSSQARVYKESFEKRWPSLVYSNMETTLERFEMPRKVDELSLKVIENFNASAASKSLEQEIREVFLGAFGGLGVAGLSASLLTSVLETTLEDLLALGLCSAGGLLAISNFPARRQIVMNKVSKVVDALARDVEEAMQKDLVETISSLENFVNIISRPYQESAQQRLDKIVEIQEELADVDRRLRGLQTDIQNLHVS